MQPWLSILVPVYNVKPYLDDCFNSLFMQDLSGVEIIAVDDQSTDDSFAHLMAIAQVANGAVQVLQHNKNKGLSGARNTLITAAKGDYLWFLDSDDALAPNAVQQLKTIVDQHTPDLVICDYQIWRPDVAQQKDKEKQVASFGGIARLLQNNPEDLFKGLYQRGKLHAWSKIAKRIFWDESLRFPEGRYFEDMVTTPRLALRVNSFYYQDSVWVMYRQRAGSILAVPSLKKVDDMAEGVSGVLRLWLEKYPDMSASARFAFIQYNVKLFFFILKELKRLGELPQRKNIYKEKLFLNTHTTRTGLLKAYVQQGQVGRLFKVLLKLL